MFIIAVIIIIFSSFPAKLCLTNGVFARHFDADDNPTFDYSVADNPIKDWVISH